MNHYGKRILWSGADYEQWIYEVVAAWAGDALEDAVHMMAFCQGKEERPKSYPVAVVWKGVREFFWEYVYPEELAEKGAHA